MSWAERLAAERRLRLAAEAMTRQREAELKAARAQLAERTTALARQATAPANVVPMRAALQLAPQHAGTAGDGAAGAVIRAEQQLWEAVEAMGEGFALFDTGGRMIGANGVFRDLFGDGPTAPQPGQTLSAILGAAVAAGQVDAWTDPPADSGPVPVALRDGRCLRLTRQPTREGGEVCLAVDVTEAARQAHALREASLANESASRAKSAFLANMSHELRTPLNGVLGMAEMLCDSALPPEPRLFADTIRTSAEALLRLIDDVLDYSRLQAGRIALRTEVFEIDALLHEIALMMEPAARMKGLALDLDCDLFLPERVVGDPGRLRQVVVNLLGNAVKFTAEGMVRLAATGHHWSGADADGDGLMLRIIVEDTGIGIAPEHHDHVFAEFAQVEASANRAFDGAGLGLAICRDLVAAMAGEIWLDSTPGKGACFGFCVPLACAGGQVQPALLPLPPARVLLLDDRPVARTLTRQRLRPLGLTVVDEDATGDTAPDAIIVHAGQTGRLDRLRAQGCDAPALLLSDTPPTEGSDASVLPADPSRGALLAALGAILAPRPDRGGPMRVLSAEDNRTNQLVFTKMLRDLDIDLRFAGDGHEAVALFRTFRPDLVFMDISMPGMDGREATRAIRAIEAEEGTAPVPIVALTAHALDGDREDILAAGLDDYLTKPLRRAAICDQIARHCPPGRRPVQPQPPLSDRDAGT